MLDESEVFDHMAKWKSREEFWGHFINTRQVNHVAEIGVYRGEFASKILKACPGIKTYYMIDPWRHLDDWNKPANSDDETFEKYFEETKDKTDFASAKRIILRGKTTEVIHKIPDNSLDLVYVDGDHTLRGIVIDLICAYRKVRVGGYIGGDDFTTDVWQHTSFEPTFVFPFAIYFAEAMSVPIWGLPNNQFLIKKVESQSFTFIDLADQYNRYWDLRSRLHPAAYINLRMMELFRGVKRHFFKTGAGLIKRRLW